ncbi:hypothetical protein EBZ70_04360 [bacterium]|nr:hypothetical protein [bacterium]
MKTNFLSNVAIASLSFLCLVPLAHSQTSAQSDLDRDGIPNISDPDVDNDGIPNGSDRNIDGGMAKSGPLKGKFIGDRIANDNAAELDMDADGLLDNAASETDIDGDGLADNSKLELDIDGDGRANGLDGDLDGDGLVNNSDADMYGTGVINDYFQTAGADAAYAPDASVASTIAYVSGEVRRVLQIPATDKGLRVRVSASQFGSLIYGVWRYLSADNIQVYATWCYPSSDPSQLKVFVDWIYTGPYSGIVEDYTNPANYAISEENRLSAQYPGGGFTFIGWVPPEPTGFYFSAPNEQATGFAPPYEKLRAALSSYPDFSSSPQYLDFSGSLVSTPGFPGVQPIINLQRTIMQVSRAWYGQLEAQQLR